ncbi:MAG: M20/M25/M40 family metallo-hydrolase [Cyclobacteriaceae bacterium]
MKRVFLLFIVLAYTTCEAQQINKYIKEKRITKIISTLASDEMRGRSATSPQDIEKAATFVEKQFKKAGLQPMEGLAGYRQEFPKKRVALEDLEVTLDGEAIPEERLLLVSLKNEISMDDQTPVDTIGKSQHLFSTISQIEARPGNKIILVAKEHTENFKVAKQYLGRPRFWPPDAEGQGSTMYILDQDRPTSVSINATQSSQLVNMANVVGILPGQSKPDEKVIFSAHYDHIGIQEAIEGDSIANGADDDASGTTAVISLAKYYSKMKSNQRTLIFVAFTAEEIGGFGSKHFSEQLNPDQIVAMFNIEMIGKPSKWGQNAAFITGFERSNFGEILQKNLEGSSFQIHPDPYPEQNLFYRSDNATLARLGVPAHSISTDQIPTDPYYHTVDDEVVTLDMANITAAIRGIALGAQTIVDGTDTPTRVDKSKVQ